MNMDYELGKKLDRIEELILYLIQELAPPKEGETQPKKRIRRAN